MAEAGYVSLAEHRHKHQLFTQKIKILMQRFESGEDILLDLLTISADWLIEHIARDDMAFARQASMWL